MQSKIKLLVMDMDGTLTDGKIYIGNNGEMFKSFCVKDGYGITHILPNNSIESAVITGRQSEIAKYRCKELGIKYLYQGIKDKLKTMEHLMSELSLDYKNIAYIGDDDNDLECMQKAGITGCPADSSMNIIKISDFVSKKTGGNGAVRDFIEWIIFNEGVYENVAKI